MPKTDFTQYDKDPANNTDIDGVDIAEGCAPSGINNAIRSVMSHIAEMNDGTVAMTSPVISGDLTVDTNTLYVDSTNNNVGIGTSSPGATLTLESDTDASIDITGTSVSTQDVFIKLDAPDNSAAYIGIDDSEQLLKINNGNALSSLNHLVIDRSGNVGIGTASPTSLGTGITTLHLKGNSASQTDRAGGIRFERYDGTYGGAVYNADGAFYHDAGAHPMLFYNNSTERMRIDGNGNLLVGKADADFDVAGILMGGGVIHGIRNNAHPLALNRQTSDGDIIQFYKDGSAVGSASIQSYGFEINGEALHSGISFGSVSWVPLRDGSRVDNTLDLGTSVYSFDDLYATNGTIQTSDRNEKENIASMSDAEITAAKAISKLFKTFKWKDAVAEKGDSARTHAGVIAQDVQQAMADAGLDAGNYAFFISSTWWETQTEVPAVEAVEAVDAVYEDVVIPAVEEQLDEEGNVIVEAQPERVEQRLVSEAVEAVEGKEAYTRTDTYETAEEAPAGATERTRLGIRYPELLAFIGAATEQRLASIEARLDALEA